MLFWVSILRFLAVAVISLYLAHLYSKLCFSDKLYASLHCRLYVSVSDIHSAIDVIILIYTALVVAFLQIISHFSVRFISLNVKFSYFTPATSKTHIYMPYLSRGFRVYLLLCLHYFTTWTPKLYAWGLHGMASVKLLVGIMFDHIICGRSMWTPFRLFLWKRYDFQHVVVKHIVNSVN